jgi:LmbE family N-acetylglucosaminyl deacetylase
VVTHWKVGRHRDHRIASELVRDACFLSGLKKLDAEGAPFRPLKLVYATAFREDAGPPDFVVDVSQHLRKKLEALSAYSSQFDGVRGIGEVYPGGERLVLEQVRMQMAHYGTYIRVEYGEPFRTDEPFDVADLSELTVASF